LKEQIAQRGPGRVIAANTVHTAAGSMVFLRVLLMIDTHMSRIRDARLGWVSVSVALGLTSTRGKTLTQLAAEMGITKQPLSKPTAKLLRVTGLDPAFGLKSPEMRSGYQQTNGHSAV
jgi:hypothetical protein